MADIDALVAELRGWLKTSGPERHEVFEWHLPALLDALESERSARVRLEEALILNPRAARIAELPDFMAALSEWGCDDPNEQAAAITDFLNSLVGLREYLEDSTHLRAKERADV